MKPSLSILFMTVSANTGNETTLKDRQDKSLGVFTVVKVSTTGVFYNVLSLE